MKTNKVSKFKEKKYAPMDEYYLYNEEKKKQQVSKTKIAEVSSEESDDEEFMGLVPPWEKNKGESGENLTKGLY
jgi:hypothetical protein